MYGWEQRMASKYMILLLISVVLVSFSQILLKMSADNTYGKKIREYLNLYVLSAYSMFFISTFLNVLAFKGVELKYGQVFATLNYVFILIFSKLFLNENITKNKLLGNLLIILGVIIFSL